MLISLVFILILTFIFGYLNGLNGGGSVLATVISSRALAPRTAVLMTIACIGAGPFLLGLAVASAISADLVTSTAVTMPVVIAALAGAVTWVSLAAWLRLPSSTTHAFIGSLLGATWAGFGLHAIVADGVIKLVIALFLSPFIGIAAGYLVVKFCYRASSSATPRINNWFKAGQVALYSLVAVSFGSVEGQKIIGIVALGLAAAQGTDFVIPYWAAGFAVVAMVTGTLVSGQRIARTLGGRLYKIRPIHGFGAQTASGLVLLSASLLGGPVSGSHVIASSIVGAGSAERMRMVRWGVFRQILSAWVLTIPASAMVGALIYLISVRLYA
jgi:inorganic phosphate transporter, PiT family